MGTIKVNKKVSKNGYPYFQGLIAANKDYKTKEKLYLSSLINFKNRDIKDTIEDGDYVSFVGSLILQKNTFSKTTDINLFIETVTGINVEEQIDEGGVVVNQEPTQEDLEKMEELDELPFWYEKEKK